MEPLVELVVDHGQGEAAHDRHHQSAIASAPIAIAGRKQVMGLHGADDDCDASSVMSDDHKPSPSSAVNGPSGTSPKSCSNAGSLDGIHVSAPRHLSHLGVASSSTPSSTTREALLVATSGVDGVVAAATTTVPSSCSCNNVSIILNDGANFEATPYEHSVSGHHIMLSEKGKVWKATRALREATFYERVSRHLQIGRMKMGSSSESEPQSLSEVGGEEVDGVEVESATLIEPFLPKYYGTRKVSKLRCQGSSKTAPSNKESRTEQFPAAPTHVADGPYDASAPHTARDVVQSFLVEKKQSPGTTTPPTLAGSDGSGDDLGQGLPRADDSFVDMIVLEDVCGQMKEPCVLDIKMGTRQYGVDAAPEKKRSKNAKTLKSTSSSLGLRLAGLKMYDSVRHVHVSKGKGECRYLAPLEVEQSIFDFCQQNEEICGKFLSLVNDIRHAFQRQRSYRFFTSSLLLVYDAVDPVSTARIVMIDFAYTYTAAELRIAGDEDQHLTHDVGYLKGLESLLAMLARNAHHGTE